MPWTIRIINEQEPPAGPERDVYVIRGEFMHGDMDRLDRDVLIGEYKLLSDAETALNLILKYKGVELRRGEFAEEELELFENLDWPSDSTAPIFLATLRSVEVVYRDIDGIELPCAVEHSANKKRK